jgi:hypothetical protein
MTDYIYRENKGYYANNPKKKAHCIAYKTIVVIDESLVKALSINEDTWFEQVATEDGILLKLLKKTK